MMQITINIDFWDNHKKWTVFSSNHSSSFGGYQDMKTYSMLTVIGRLEENRVSFPVRGELTSDKNSLGWDKDYIIL